MIHILRGVTAYEQPEIIAVFEDLALADEAAKKCKAVHKAYMTEWRKKADDPNCVDLPPWPYAWDENEDYEVLSIPLSKSSRSLFKKKNPA